MLTYLYYAAERKLALRGIDTIPKGEKLLPVRNALLCIKLTEEIINKSINQYGEPNASFDNVLEYQRSLVIYKEKDDLYGLKICLVSFERVFEGIVYTHNADFETSVTIARHCTMKEIYDYILSICQYGKDLIVNAKNSEEVKRIQIDKIDIALATNSIMEEYNGQVIVAITELTSIDDFDLDLVFDLDDFIEVGKETTFTYQEKDDL